jgi:GNAT superfamily N-acetyltransferase
MPTELQLSDSQYINAWSHFARNHPLGKVERLDGVTAVFAGVPMPFFNLLFPDAGFDTGDQLTSRLRSAMDWAGTRNVPGFAAVNSGWFTTEEQGRPEEIASGLGLAPQIVLKGMIADNLAPAARPAPELEYRPVVDAGTRRAMVEINWQAYGMPPGGGTMDLDAKAIWAKPAYGVVGCVDGKPVTCSATFLVDGCLYVGWVATLPESQRKGYGDAVMRRSLDEAAKDHGSGRTVLHATPAGFPVYEKMGYRTVCEYTLYGLKHD